MSTARVNGVRLYYELHGNGEVPVVLVHGSWDSHESWDIVAALLSESFRVLVYDRRGHSQSEHPAGQGSVREDVADLAALIEHLKLAPAWVVGNSFGASIALRLAAEHPELLRGLIAHEPPLLSLFRHDPVLAPLWQEVHRHIDAVVQRIAAGDHAGAAEQFVEAVALGPGMWEQLPAPVQQILIENALTFFDEAHDPEQFDFDPEGIRDFPRPILLTHGAHSPPIFAPVVEKLAEVSSQIEVVRFPNSGHVPHATHPDMCAGAIRAFIQRSRL